MNFFIVFLASLMINANTELVEKKLQKLQLLTFVELKNGTTNWPACAAAMEIVIEAANNDDDILPGYEFVIRQGDEGANSLTSNKALIDFVRTTEESKQLVAPAILGPKFSCQTSGLTLKTLGFVQYSPSCVGSYTYERRQSYALVVSQAMMTVLIWPVVQFVKQVGKWNQIAILAEQANPNSFEIALQMKEFAQDQQISVVHFASDNRYVDDSTVIDLKNSGARVIVIVQGHFELCLYFLCKAYQYGMRAPQYVFIAVSFNCLVPNVDKLEIPKTVSCTKQEIRQQVENMFASGTMAEPENGRIRCHFGYDYNEFQRRMDEKTKGNFLPDNVKKLLCHDAAMAAVIAMDRAERVMKSRPGNLTLANFGTNPLEIQKYILKESRRLDFASIRIGRFKVDPSDGYIKEDGYIAQAYNGSINIKYRLPIALEGFNSTISLISESIWGTKYNKIPKDLSQIVLIPYQCDKRISYAIFGIAFIGSIFQVFLAIADKRFSKWIRYSFTAGCLLLLIAPAFHLLGRDFSPHVECRLRPVPTVLGLTIVGCVVSVLSIRFSKTKIQFKMQKNSTQLFRQLATLRRTPTMSSRSSSNLPPLVPHAICEQKNKKLELFAVVLFGGCSLVMLIIWIAATPMETQHEFGTVYFSEQFDQHAQNDWLQCWSETSVYWIVTFIVINAFLLLISAVLCYSADKKARQTNLLQQYRTLSVSTINQFVMLIGFSLIMIASSSFEPCTHGFIFSALLIIYSVVSHVTLFNPNQRQ